MFTGIIDHVGQIYLISKLQGGLRLKIVTKWPRLKNGESISVNGVCLTHESADKSKTGIANFFASSETLKITNLTFLRSGEKVNLERPLTPKSFLGGHWVQGHCDGVAKIQSIKKLRDGSHEIEVKIPKSLESYLVPKGSITVDGISLTINDLGTSSFSVRVVPGTFRLTTIREYKPGRRVNIEIDILSKYIKKHLKHYLGARR